MSGLYHAIDAETTEIMCCAQLCSENIDDIRFDKMETTSKSHSHAPFDGTSFFWFNGVVCKSHFVHTRIYESVNSPQFAQQAWDLMTAHSTKHPPPLRSK